ncbi:MAG: peptidase S8 [Deltaproteobacteria bacterium]|nr:MAG: peptidase S8 [Deltaproteobacteria bacterium]
MRTLFYMSSLATALIVTVTPLKVQGAQGENGRFYDVVRPYEVTTIPEEPQFVPGQVIVRFGNVPNADIAAVKRTLGLKTINQIPEAGVELLAIESDLDVDATISALYEAGIVEYAEPNYLRYALRTPNDPRYDELYGLEKIEMPQTWDARTMSDVVVAVADSGGDWQHEDLLDNTWINAGEDINRNGVFDQGDLNGRDDDGNGYVDDVVGYNFYNDSPIPFDNANRDMHGTHVSGTIGAVGNNRTGITGVLWDVKIMRLKFIHGISGNDFDAAKAIRYAVDNGAQVINNSWGGRGSSTTIEEAVRYADQNDVVFVAAAGNEGNDNDRTATYPANYPFDNVISVAATDSRDRMPGFSNFGRTSVHVAAPGVGILSTVPDDRYQALDGTSMAAPHVSGVAALLLAANSSLTPKRIREILIETSDPVSGLAGRVVANGRINVFRALTCALGGECSGGPGPDPEPDPGGGCGVVGHRSPSGLFALAALLFLVGWKGRRH